MFFVLAHQGGWDEFLIFVVPVALGMWGLRFTAKRAAQKAKEKQDAPGGQ
jgi:hypothetical protein